MGIFGIALISFVLTFPCPPLALLVIKRSQIYDLINARLGVRGVGSVLKKTPWFLEKFLNNRKYELSDLHLTYGFFDWGASKKHTIVSILTVLSYVLFFTAIILHPPLERVFFIAALCSMIYPILKSLNAILSLIILWVVVRKSIICNKCGKKLYYRVYSREVEVPAQDYRTPGYKETVYFHEWICANCYRQKQSQEQSTEGQNLLANIAKNDKSREAREQAIRKLNPSKWQGLLADIAKNDKYYDVRAAAMEILEDQKVLTGIAQNDKNYFVRKAAVEKLKDQELLSKIAKNDKYYDVRTAAVEILEDQKVLTGIAQNDKNYFVRKVAKERLEELKKKTK